MKNASQFGLYFYKEYCLKFIIKEINYNQIVMSEEFETLEKPLMIEIIRRRQAPPIPRSNIVMDQDNLHVQIPAISPPFISPGGGGGLPFVSYLFLCACIVQLCN